MDTPDRKGGQVRSPDDEDPISPNLLDTSDISIPPPPVTGPEVSSHETSFDEQDLHPRTTSPPHPHPPTRVAQANPMVEFINDLRHRQENINSRLNALRKASGAGSLEASLEVEEKGVAALLAELNSHLAESYRELPPDLQQHLQRTREETAAMLQDIRTSLRRQGERVAEDLTIRVAFRTNSGLGALKNVECMVPRQWFEGHEAAWALVGPSCLGGLLPKLVPDAPSQWRSVPYVWDRHRGHFTLPEIYTDDMLSGPPLQLYLLGVHEPNSPRSTCLRLDGLPVPETSDPTLITVRIATRLDSGRGGIRNVEAEVPTGWLLEGLERLLKADRFPAIVEARWPGHAPSAWRASPHWWNVVEERFSLEEPRDLGELGPVPQFYLLGLWEQDTDSPRRRHLHVSELPPAERLPNAGGPPIDWAGLFTSFYHAQNPSKVGNVPALLRKYVNEELSLWKMLLKRYNVTNDTWHIPRPADDGRAQPPVEHPPPASSSPLPQPQPLHPAPEPVPELPPEYRHLTHTPPPPQSPPNSEAWEAKLTAFYKQYNPEKVVKVPQLLTQFRGEEHNLWNVLQIKYLGALPPNQEGENEATPEAGLNCPGVEGRTSVPHSDRTAHRASPDTHHSTTPQRPSGGRTSKTSVPDERRRWVGCSKHAGPDKSQPKKTPSSRARTPPASGARRRDATPPGAAGGSPGNTANTPSPCKSQVTDRADDTIPTSAPVTMPGCHVTRPGRSVTPPSGIRGAIAPSTQVRSATPPSRKSEPFSRQRSAQKREVPQLGTPSGKLPNWNKTKPRTDAGRRVRREPPPADPTTAADTSQPTPPQPPPTDQQLLPEPQHPVDQAEQQPAAPQQQQQQQQQQQHHHPVVVHTGGYMAPTRASEAKVKPPPSQPPPEPQQAGSKPNTPRSGGHHRVQSPVRTTSPVRTSSPSRTASPEGEQGRPSASPHKPSPDRPDTPPRSPPPPESPEVVAPLPPPTSPPQQQPPPETANEGGVSPFATEDNPPPPPPPVQEEAEERERPSSTTGPPPPPSLPEPRHRFARSRSAGGKRGTVKPTPKPSPAKRRAVTPNRAHPAPQQQQPPAKEPVPYQPPPKRSDPDSARRHRTPRKSHPNPTHPPEDEFTREHNWRSLGAPGRGPLTAMERFEQQIRMKGLEQEMRLERAEQARKAEEKAIQILRRQREDMEHRHLRLEVKLRREDEIQRKREAIRVMREQKRQNIQQSTALRRGVTPDYASPQSLQHLQEILGGDMRVNYAASNSSGQATPNPHGPHRSPHRTRHLMYPDTEGIAVPQFEPQHHFDGSNLLSYGGPIHEGIDHGHHPSVPPQGVYKPVPQSVLYGSTAPPMYSPTATGGLHSLPDDM